MDIDRSKTKKKAGGGRGRRILWGEMYRGDKNGEEGGENRSKPDALLYF